jgi:tetratricopeptide (TPR) repeat protein
MPGRKDAQSQSAAIHGSHIINVQIQGDGNTVIHGLPHLALIPPRNRAREIGTEIDLLNAYCRSIPLIGREADMQSLWDWLHLPGRPVAVRTIKGGAGAGKTRIAIELIERLDAKEPGKWFAGFVRGREMRRFAAQQSLSEWSWARPTLVVVDYAASLIEPLREWLRDLAQNSARNDGKPLRLLLLEREANAGEGWLQFLCSGGFAEANVQDLFDPPEPKSLEPLDTLEKRRAVLGGMLAEAAKLASCPPPKLPAPGQNAVFDQQLKNDEWADPLYLMMAALLSLRSDLVTVLRLPRTRLALELAKHEIRRLIKGVPHDAERLPVHLTAFVAMGGGLTQKLALNIAEEESAALSLNYPGGAGALVAKVHEVLPAPDQAIAPIVPDILAEALVLWTMKDCSAAQQADIILRAERILGRRIIPFILRTIQDFAADQRAELLKPAAPRPADASDECGKLLQHVKLWDWLERLIQTGQSDDPVLLAEIEGAMPHDTVKLREKAVEVDELLAERWSKKARENPREEILSEQSRLLNNLSNRLSDLGRREEALAKAEEAGRIYAQLAQARPDAFLPDLAGSLNNLATMLSDLGRREEALAKAEQAVRIREQLAQARPEAFLPDLATSCGARGVILLAINNHIEAAASFAQGIRALTPMFQTTPSAFAQLIGKLCLHYIQACEQAQKEPEMELLAPVTEVFKKLKQNQPKE